jgi:hypothetical protein
MTAEQLIKWLPDYLHCPPHTTPGVTERPKPSSRTSATRATACSPRYHPEGEVSTGAPKLLQITQDLRLGQRFTFQQDNNPKHTDKTMQEWLRDKSLNVLEWPRLSPDQKSLERPENSCATTLPIQLDKAREDLERICRETP